MTSDDADPREPGLPPPPGQAGLPPGPAGPPPPVVEPVVATRRRWRGGRAVAAIVGLAVLALVIAVAAVQLAPAPPVPPRIAVVAADGSLSIVDATGVPLSALGGGAGLRYGPPAWSPDGTRVAAIGGTPTTAALRVFDVDGPGPGETDSRVLYESADRPPFYLSWAPDGARVGFLATEDDEITLRTAPADGSAARDGTAGDGILRTGAPLYFAWQGGERLLLHVGLGAGAFTGPIDLAGAELGTALEGSGDFRPAVVSPDGLALAFARGAADAGAVVISGLDGAVRSELPVFGPVAMAFEPGGGTLSVVGADRPLEEPIGFPLGPLRLVSADGAPRTLLEDGVAAAWWSPDGSTIAALQLLPTGPGTEAAAARLAVAEPGPTIEVHLVFVGVAGGEIRSDRVVRLGSAYVTTILPYFDQYAMSHGVWAPDGSAIVLPLQNERGMTRITVLGADGDDRPIAEGIHATWAP